MRRIALLTAFSLLALTTATGPARASGLVLGERATGPVSLRVAASSDGTLTTRWQSMVVPAGQRVAWLVPVRPGARVDLTGDAFLAALDEATAVQVARPRGGTAACGPEGQIETIANELPTEQAQKESETPFLLANEAELQQFATSQGLVVPKGASTRAFRDGFSLLALTFESRARPTTTPVVRVTDDGPVSLPLVLADSLATDVELTTYVIAEGAVQVGSRATLPWGAVTWGLSGSTYRDERSKLLVSHRGFGFLTEAAGHDLVFGPRALLPDGTLPPSLAATYASRVARTPAESASCAAALARMTNHPVRFGVVCPPGALAAVPPESACVAKAGDSDVTTAMCGTAQDDLAIALSGKRIDRIAVTRAAGLLLAGSLGSYVGTASAEEKDPVVTAKLAETCLPPSQLEPPGPSAPPRRTGAGGTVSSTQDPGPSYTYDNGGCSSGGAVYVGSGSSTTSSSDTGSDDSCSSSGTESSDSDDAGCGGDTVGGDNDGSSDACSSDSSSDSSDSCDSGSGDSCDSPDASNRKGKPGKSPMSRAAFIIVALALPLRRLFRKRDETNDTNDEASRGETNDEFRA